MLKHEFGMMMADPRPGQIFEEYEPEQYDCIAVDDEYVVSGKVLASIAERSDSLH